MDCKSVSVLIDEFVKKNTKVLINSKHANKVGTILANLRIKKFLIDICP
jgi:hypothetical protein